MRSPTFGAISVGALVPQAAFQDFTDQHLPFERRRIFVVRSVGNLSPYHPERGCVRERLINPPPALRHIALPRHCPRPEEPGKQRMPVVVDTYVPDSAGKSALRLERESGKTLSLVFTPTPEGELSCDVFNPVRVYAFKKDRQVIRLAPNETVQKVSQFLSNWQKKLQSRLAGLTALLR